MENNSRFIFGIFPLHTFGPEHNSDDPFGGLVLRVGDGIIEKRTQQGSVYICGSVVEQMPSDIEQLPTSYGIFAFVGLDAKKKELHVGTDQFGLAPLFYCILQKFVIFSTSITLVKNAIAEREPDLAAWDARRITGDILGSRTVLRRVSRLRCGERLRLGAGKYALEVFWKPTAPVEEVHGSTYLQRNNELLHSALLPLASQDRTIVIPLSGGDDSRRLAVAAVRAEIDALHLSQQAFGPGNFDEDTQVAAAVARSLNLKFRKVEVPTISRLIEDYLASNEVLNWEISAHLWAFALARELPQNCLVVDGIGFDVTINGHYFRAFPKQLDAWNSAEQVANLLLSSVHPRQYPADRVVRVKDDMVKEIESLPAFRGRLNLYKLLNHTRRAIGSWHQIFARAGHDVVAPHFEKNLFGHCLQVDPKKSAVSFGQIEAVRLVDPKVADIPSTRRQVPSSMKINLEIPAAIFTRQLLSQVPIRDEAYDALNVSRARGLAKRLAHPFQRERSAWYFLPLVEYSLFLDWLQEEADPFEGRGRFVNGSAPYDAAEFRKVNAF